jgi:hypothetical protein
VCLSIGASTTVGINVVSTIMPAVFRQEQEWLMTEQERLIPQSGRQVLVMAKVPENRFSDHLTLCFRLVMAEALEALKILGMKPRLQAGSRRPVRSEVTAPLATLNAVALLDKGRDRPLRVPAEARPWA